ncbi:MAG: hypothetical protein ACLGIT_01055 [Gammaproteobacteria bacterium]|uniref:hypothetical protein n=1 Tax=Azohydromonas sp. TaxID=1872666 RepID=UPI002B895CDA|nr:hypothetical protein [Azohydromonas sp.]HMM84790.1 hypothetical protein [Azohydromonas sp.]
MDVLQMSAPPRGRRHAAAALRVAARVLARWAERLAARPAAAHVGELEFHAEAGAPEGALYVDGMLVARLPGVDRL